MPAPWPATAGSPDATPAWQPSWWSACSAWSAPRPPRCSWASCRFTAAIDGGYGWLAALAVANTVASLFYYLCWLAPVFRQARETGAETLEPARRWAALTAYIAGTGSLAIGIVGAAVLALVAGHLTS